MKSTPKATPTGIRLRTVTVGGRRYLLAADVLDFIEGAAEMFDGKAPTDASNVIRAMHSDLSRTLAKA